MSKKRFISLHIVAAVFIVSLCVGLSFLLTPLFNRFWIALRDFGLCIAYFIQRFFGIEDWDIHVYINESVYVEGFSLSLLPDNPGLFFNELWLSIKNIFSIGYWINFHNHLFPIILGLIFIIIFLVILFALLLLFLRSYFKNHDEAVGVETRPHKIYMHRRYIFTFIKEYIVDLLTMIKEIWYYRLLLILAALFFSNVLAIAFSLVGYLFYFLVTFDFLSIWFQIVRLFTDISFLFKFYFLPFWIIFIFVMIKRKFIKTANNKKGRILVENKKFVYNKTSISTLFVGLMGLGKTTLMTDISITTEEMFFEKAKEMMDEIIYSFPLFDFRPFEKYLDNLIESHVIFNLANTKLYLNNHIKDSDTNDNDYLIPQYAYENGNAIIFLKDKLVEYGQLYLLYNSSSLIYSNYAIRSGIFAYSVDHLKEYVNDFIRSNDDYYESSNFAHIFDFNNFRTEKKINNRLEYSKVCDFGVFALDEIGKERLNKIELEDIKKGSDDVNQKNDGFNKYIKMGRHTATINNYPFFKVYSAEQRIDSVPADFRELNNKIFLIKDNVEKKNLFPFYDYLNFIISIPEGFVFSLYNKYRFNRDENSLIFQIIKNILSFIYRFRERMNNLYGFRILTLGIVNADGVETGTCRYYLLNSKIYNRRFSTDAYADVFDNQHLESKFGINDVISYKKEKASLDELRLQNAYFIDSLLKEKDKEKTQEKNNTNTKRGWKKVI